MVTSLKPRRSRSSKRAAKRYSSDLSDRECVVIRPLLPPPCMGRGRKREVDEREILNAIFSQIHNGCIWSDLPSYLPAWQTVYKYFRAWQPKGIFRQIHEELRRKVRVSVSKPPNAPCWQYR